MIMLKIANLKDFKGVCLHIKKNSKLLQKVVNSQSNTLYLPIVSL